MFLVFIGQNATTGSPNRITGYHSKWGRFRKFKTRKERDEYYNNWSSNNPSEKIWKCGLQSSRKFNLGSSVYDHQEHLNFTPYTIKVLDECEITGRVKEYWAE